MRTNRNNGAFTPLSPRQMITAAPNSVSQLRSGGTLYKCVKAVSSWTVSSPVCLTNGKKKSEKKG